MLFSIKWFLFSLSIKLFGCPQNPYSLLFKLHKYNYFLFLFYKTRFLKYLIRIGLSAIICAVNTLLRRKINTSIKLTSY